MAHWFAYVEDHVDLQMLTEGLTVPECELSQSNGHWVLRSTLLDSLTDAGAVRAKATALLKVLSGASMTLLGTPKAFELGAVVFVRDDGTQCAYVFPESADAKVRAVPIGIKVSRADGSTFAIPPAEPLNGWLRSALSDEHVNRALRIRARGPLD